MKYLIVKKKYLKNSYEDDFEIVIKGYKYAYTKYKDYSDKCIYLTLVYVKESNKHSVDRIERYVEKKERYRVGGFKYFLESLKNSTDFEYKYNNKKNKSKIFIAASTFFKSIKEIIIRKLNNLLYKTKVKLLKLKLKFFQNNILPFPPDKNIIESMNSFIESDEDKEKKLFTDSMGIYTDKEFIINGELWKRNW